jgi:uncharacterized membrane protein (DUF485 family)
VNNHDFILRYQAMTRASNRVSIWFFSGMFVLLLGMVPLLSYERGSPLFQDVGPVVGVAVLVLLFGSVPVLIWYHWRQKARFDVRCPGCHRQLLGTSGQIVIATGNCGHCGSRVLSESHAA